MRKTITIKVHPNPRTRSVVFSTKSRSIPRRRVQVFSYIQLLAAYRLYANFLEHKFGVEIDVRKPNLYSAFVNCIPVTKRVLAVTSHQQGKTAALGTINEIGNTLTEQPFEVNMMEPLVGWKRWKIWDGGGLVSSGGLLWKPDESVVAGCQHSSHGVPSPIENCSCGIYAADREEGSRNYGEVLGTVYGWGRYVRGESGWRAQFAYPKSFLLSESQVGLIDALRKYHVPIYIQQPQLVYNPEEDGYEHRSEEAYRDSGAVEYSSPEEED